MLVSPSHHRTVAAKVAIRPARRRGVWWSIALLLMIANSGCTGLRLPAIDPTGERIFLPSRCTSLDDGSSFNGPAWSSLPQAPLCGTPAASAATVPYSLNTPTPPLYGPFTAPNPYGPNPNPAAAFGRPSPQLTGVTSTDPRDGIQGRLALSPERLQVPIGQEVIIRAAICGSDGYLATREPLEWSLAPNSVGTILEVDQQNKTFLRQVFGGPPYKQAADFAQGLTSRRPQVVPRGTPSPYDDLQLARGETWISVTSASPGEMHVHCLAPTVAGWEQRRATSTIQWIGPGGVAPTPGVPVPATPTRPPYPPGAPTPAAPSTNPPANLPPTLPPTNPTSPPVPTAKPNVELSITGPRTAKADEALTYKISIRNTGQADARDVEVSSKIPLGMRNLESIPDANVFGDRLVWKIITLPPGQSRDVTLRHVGERGGTMNLCATLDYRGASRTERCTSTTIEQNALSVDVRSPRTVRIGQSLPVLIQITNHSDRDLNNVIVLDEYGSGLYYADGRGAIEGVVGTIPARQTRSFENTFEVRGAGRLCHTVTVRADDGSEAKKESCVDAGAATSGGPRFDGPAFGGPTLGGANRAALVVQKTGPVRMGVGSKGLFTIKITNTGQVPLNGLRVIDEFDPRIIPVRATYGVQRTGNSIDWRLPQLGVGQTTTIEVECEGGGPADRACNRVRVTSDEGATGEDDMCVPILPRGGATWKPDSRDAPNSSYPSQWVADQPDHTKARLDGHVQPVRESIGNRRLEPAPAVSEYGPPRSRSFFSPFKPLGSQADSHSNAQANLANELPPAAPERLPREAFGDAGSDVNGVGSASQATRARRSTARPTPMKGDWQVSIRRRSGSSQQGRQTTYTVAITNRHDEVEENVILTIESPQGTEFSSSLNPPMIRETRRSSDGRTVEFLPISSLRPGETATFQIVVRANSATAGAMRAKVQSDRWPQGSVFTD